MFELGVERKGCRFRGNIVDGVCRRARVWRRWLAGEKAGSAVLGRRAKESALGPAPLVLVFGALAPGVGLAGTKQGTRASIKPARHARLGT